MLTPANEQIFVDKAGHIPANTTITIADPIAAGFQTAIETGFARPTAKELNGYWGNFGDAIVKAVDAGTDPTTLVADACSKMDQANASLGHPPIRGDPDAVSGSPQTPASHALR